jgi:hypothetical protein
MRTKTIIDGFRNSQKFRVAINGILLHTTIKDMAEDQFVVTEQRVAVWDAIMRLAMERRQVKNTTGFAGDFRGFQVQVDLIN